MAIFNKNLLGQEGQEGQVKSVNLYKYILPAHA